MSAPVPSLTRAWRLARETPALSASLAVFALCAVAFFGLTDEVLEEPVHRLDNAVLLALRIDGDLGQPRGPEWLSRAMVDLTALGGVSVLTLLCGLVLGFLLLERRWRTALLVAASVGGGCLFCVAMKHFVARARPEIVPHLVQASGGSFPSGHSLLSSVVYFTLAALLSRIVSKSRERVYLFASASAIVFLVGFTRIYLGVHYPSDVLAGWCGGVAWALLCWIVAALSAPSPAGRPA